VNNCPFDTGAWTLAAASREQEVDNEDRETAERDLLILMLAGGFASPLLPATVNKPHRFPKESWTVEYQTGTIAEPNAYG
jgi:hypothetical protein